MLPAEICRAVVGGNSQNASFVLEQTGRLRRGPRMKMLAEYLDSAIKFETLAAAETDAKLKAQFEKQAEAYRKLAEKRAKEYGLQPPSGQL